MPKIQAKRRLRSDFIIGAEQAEADLLLERAFYETAYYDAISSRLDTRAFIVGRTGSGKSALLQHLEAELPDHVIRINPENLSLTYITDLGVVKYI
jgi:polynucleotide 5'-kinase involved in rRNA processing